MCKTCTSRFISKGSPECPICETNCGFHVLISALPLKPEEQVPVDGRIYTREGAVYSDEFVGGIRRILQFTKFLVCKNRSMWNEETKSGPLAMIGIKSTTDRTLLGCRNVKISYGPKKETNLNPYFFKIGRAGKLRWKLRSNQMFAIHELYYQERYSVSHDVMNYIYNSKYPGSFMELARKQEIAFVTGEKGPLQLIKEIVESRLVGRETGCVLEVEKITDNLMEGIEEEGEEELCRETFSGRPYIISHITQEGKSFKEKEVVFLDGGDKHFGSGIQILNPESLEEEEPMEIDDDYLDEFYGH